MTCTNARARRSDHFGAAAAPSRLRAGRGLPFTTRMLARLPLARFGNVGGWALLGALALACSSSDSNQPETPEEEETPVSVTLEGAVQKGPFVIGSSVSVSVLNADLTPTGQVFNTQTVNDRGEFEITYTAAGPVALQGEGFYFNEVTGELSAAALTLRAFYAPDASGSQPVFINMITHLTAERIKTLVEGGTPFSTAVTQAEGDLLEQLSITDPGYRPSVRGVHMDITGGDNDDNAYLLSVSSTLIEVAIRRGGSIDAALQELLNAYALDLADGGLTTQRRGDVALALRSLDVEKVRDNLQERLSSLGSDETPPQMQSVLDPAKCCESGVEGAACGEGGVCNAGLICALGNACSSSQPEGCCLPGGAEGRPCGSDGSCAAGLACQRGNSFGEEADCAATGPESTCCLPTGGAGQACASGDSCGAGLVCGFGGCTNGMRTPGEKCCQTGGGEGQPCRAGNTCNGDLFCDDGICEVASDACGGDCGVGSECNDNGECTPIQCEFDVDCPQGSGCNGETHVCG
jgi:hypothetical protein